MVRFLVGIEGRENERKILNTVGEGNVGVEGIKHDGRASENSSTKWMGWIRQEEGVEFSSPKNDIICTKLSEMNRSVLFFQKNYIPRTSLKQLETK